MKKGRFTLITILVIVAVIIGIVMLSILFGYVKAFNVSTGVMEPGIANGKRVICMKPFGLKSSDIILFDAQPLPYESHSGTLKVLSRIVACESDKVEMKHGRLYVNDLFVDDSLKLFYFFILSITDTMNLSGIHHDRSGLIPFGDSVLVNTSYPEISKLKLQHKTRRILSGYKLNPDVFPGYDSSWTYENFGPLVVPTDTYFVLGDNRSNAADSRIRGFVKKEDVAGKIIFVH